MKDLAWLDITNSAKMKYGIQRILDFLKLLGNPQDKLANVIHVAGTNGKGSITAFLKSILIAHGYRVHRYTSPHLVEYNERIELYGKPIDDDTLNHYVDYCRQQMQVHQLDLSFFEIFTVAAFLAFAEHPADFHIIEVGLGGRLDATNVFSHPLATVISTISRDHIKILGDTVTQIAREKAGIMKPGVPLITNRQPTEVQQLYGQLTTEQHCPYHPYGVDFSIRELQEIPIYSQPDIALELPLPTIGLVGQHQWYNAATAIATLLYTLPPHTLEPQKIQQGIAETRWPGRLQQLTTGILYDLLPKAEGDQTPGWEIWLDGAHNEDASKVLSEWLAPQTMPKYLILGMLQTKEAHDFIRNLSTAGLTGILPIDFQCHTATFSHQYLGDIIQSYQLPLINFPDFQERPTIGYLEAYQYILQHLTPGRIIIAGSLYLLGQILAVQDKIEEA